MRVLLWTLSAFLFSCCERQKEANNKNERSNEIIVYDPVNGIIYDNSCADPEMKKMMKEFDEKNKRDSTVEVRRYVKP